jgi:hypothetical protein
MGPRETSRLVQGFGGRIGVRRFRPTDVCVAEVSLPVVTIVARRGRAVMWVSDNGTRLAANEAPRHC